MEFFGVSPRVVLVLCTLCFCATTDGQDPNASLEPVPVVTRREQNRIFWRIATTNVVEECLIAARQDIARVVAGSKSSTDRDSSGRDPLSSILYNHLYTNPDTLSRLQKLSVVTRTVHNIGSTVNATSPAIIWLESIFVKPHLTSTEQYIYKKMRYKFIQQCAATSPPECPIDDRYRTYDGSCNSKKHSTYGKADIALRRFLPPQYDDGIGVPRKKSNRGRYLPDARQISLVFDNSYQKQPLNTKLTQFIMQWGQFIAHDITHAPMTKDDGMAIQCCANRSEFATNREYFRKQQELEARPECCPIIVTRRNGDYIYPERKCINVVRSVSGLSSACQPGAREQINALSAFMDGSMVYGSSANHSRKLRTFSGGRLKTQVLGGAEVLPTNPSGSCTKEVPSDICFHAGDLRVDEQPGLAATHVVFAKEHNRIVDEFAALNPHWDDEKLYQEGRKIIGALGQHITYNEYLPIVLGNKAMHDYRLLPRRAGYWRGYNPDADASIFNSFATVAFRFGHSMITGTMSRVAGNGTELPSLNLKDGFQKPYLLYRDPQEMGSILRGLALDHPGKVDSQLSDIVTHHLFEKDSQLGLDLVAINIQRGRDHGLPSYTAYRKRFGLSVPRSFGEMSDHTRAMQNKFRQSYRNVEDVDFFMGGLTENHIYGGIVGPLFAIIIGKQFELLKVGDRYYYENHFRKTGFTPSQLDEIRKVSLARILCNHIQFHSVHRSIMAAPFHHGNPLESCDNLPSMDLTHWQQNDCTKDPRLPYVKVSECCRGREKWVKKCKPQCADSCRGEVVKSSPCKCRFPYISRCLFCRRGQGFFG